MTKLALDTPRLKATIRRHLLLGSVCIGVLIVGVGGLAASVQLSGAVIASGRLVVEAGISRVQHPYGGVVRTVLVRQGQSVHAGDVLMRLDDTQLAAGATIIEQSLVELRARWARLIAERDGLDKVDYPTTTATWNDLNMIEIMRGEDRAFESRKAVIASQKQQLAERVEQLNQQIAGLNAALTAKGSEIDWSNQELTQVREGWKKGVVLFTKLVALERDAARLVGELGQLQASVADLKGRIAETELQILQIDENARGEISSQLQETESQIAELGQRLVAAKDQLNRVDIVAQVDGIVNELTVNLVGGVVAPSQQLMTIVPSSGELTVEARIPPQSISKVSLGQQTLLRFSALDARNTPDINGSIVFISPDLTAEGESGAKSYVVRVAVAASEIDRLGAASLVPGMPVEAFIQTGERTVLTYLVEPLSAQVSRAFRE